jgi:hypothetical protein
MRVLSTRTGGNIVLNRSPQVGMQIAHFNVLYTYTFERCIFGTLHVISGGLYPAGRSRLKPTGSGFREVRLEISKMGFPAFLTREIFIERKEKVGRK